MAKPKKIVLLSCVATKLPHPAPAKELYSSPLFKKSLQYAETLNPDDIVILSAKYYVIPLTKIIGPYNKTLLNMPEKETREWSVQVLKILADKYDLDTDHFIILAGAKYTSYRFTTVLKLLPSSEVKLNYFRSQIKRFNFA